MEMKNVKNKKKRIPLTWDGGYHFLCFRNVLQMIYPKTPLYAASSAVKQYNQQIINHHKRFVQYTIGHIKNDPLVLSLTIVINIFLAPKGTYITI